MDNRYSLGTQDILDVWLCSIFCHAQLIANGLLCNLSGQIVIEALCEQHHNRRLRVPNQAALIPDSHAYLQE